ncbi:hypothetical protein APHAL10511_003965 [Amanita phalloides]|nr:hypothetical protein APHAL10511_003965 [Amanita phalloides]
MFPRVQEDARQKKYPSPRATAPELHADENSKKGTTIKEPTTKKRKQDQVKEAGSKQAKSAEFVVSDSEFDGAGSRKPSSTVRKRQAVSPEQDAGESSETKTEQPGTKKVIEENEKSESELSILIDEPPKKRKPSKSESKPASRGPTKKKKSTEPPSKDEETIKRLKSLVVACGVRKVWSKVFEGMDKPSQQIRKLKEILSNLGMKGRFSLEQAKTIREKRELAQELEDVQTFEKTVIGRRQDDAQEDPEESEDEDEDEYPKPKRRKAGNARQSILAFLQDQSGSE